MKTVVIIDSGISEGFKKYRYRIDELSFSISEGEIKKSEGASDKIGHGTAVTDVLTSYKYSDDVRFIMIRIFEESIETDEKLLIHSLKYVYGNIACDLIHISNGITTCECLTEMEEVCDLLSKRGVILVSAFDNLGGISYPAALDNVIGVDYNFENGSVFSFDYIEDSVVNVSAKHTEQRLLWKDNKRKTLQGNSFIAPHISAIILEYLCTCGNVTIDEVKDYLRSRANRVVKGNQQTNLENVQPFKIEKACVFPFNKEIQTLIRCEDMCDFKITNYYDSRYLGKCGKALSDLLNEQFSGKRVENIDNIDWDGDFDTFILGHTDVIEKMSNCNYAEKIIEGCIAHGKNLFLFDELNISLDIIKRFKENNIKLYFPSVQTKEYSYNCGKLYSFSTPILAVLGTSSKQGKFTLQLGIKKELSGKGYDIGHLGTEPSSLLLGADDDYVLGYNSDYEPDSQKNIIRINNVMHRIDRKKHDIILVGSQSHTVPIGYSNVRMLPIYQQDILLGALPDACVLCVNHYDDADYIRRTIEYIESISETKVIALCVSIFGGSSRWTYYGGSRENVVDHQISLDRDRIANSFDIPVYMYYEIDRISSEIISYFSEDDQ